ncbi:hypothetical protein AAFC00_001615 [Neodothiora populina]
MAQIECCCNLSDPLAQYVAIDIQKNWQPHLNASACFLAKKLLEPGSICWVIVEEASSSLASVDNVIAWSIWTREGTSVEARIWQQKSDDMIQGLCAMEKSYSALEHAPTNDTHINLIKHIIYKPTVPPRMGLIEYWELDGMYVDPSYQRRGIGQMMLQWGIRQAEMESVPIVTKSSPVGVYLYEKNGFQSFERQQLDTFFEVGHKGMHCMIRNPAKTFL